MADLQQQEQHQQRNLVDLEPPTLVYWEPQEAALCAVHAINNLLQFRCIDEWQLSQIATQLAEEERRLMAAGGVDGEDYLRFLANEENPHVDESGNFSVEVIRAALGNFGLQLHSLRSQEMANAVDNPLHQEGFICNLKQHWFAVRKLATKEGSLWFNLDSTLDPPVPQIISDFYLDAFLRQLLEEQYSIFALRGTWPKQVGSPRAESPGHGADWDHAVNGNGRGNGNQGPYFTVQQIREAAEAAKHGQRPGKRRRERPPQQRHPAQQQQQLSEEEAQLQAVLRASLDEEEARLRREEARMQMESLGADAGMVDVVDVDGDMDGDDEEAVALREALALSIRSQEEAQRARHESQGAVEDEDDEEQLREAIRRSMEHHQ